MSRLVIHFQGGGWCFSVEDCASRSKSWIGSSTSWPHELSQLTMLSVGGLLSNNETLNPDFATWGIAWVTYCAYSRRRVWGGALPLELGFSF